MKMYHALLSVLKDRSPPRNAGSCFLTTISVLTLSNPFVHNTNQKGLEHDRNSFESNPRKN